MRTYLQNNSLIKLVLALLVGTAFILLAKQIIGFGAAIAVSESIVSPIAKLSPTLAVFLVDFVTIGMPLAISFCFVSWIIKQTVGTFHYYVAAAPLVLFLLYGLVNIDLSPNSLAYYSATTVSKIIPLVMCVIFLSKKPDNTKAA